MIKKANIFAHYIGSRFVQESMQLNAYKAYKFEINGLCPGTDCGPSALRSLKLDGYLPAIDVVAESVAWKVYLATYELAAEKTSLEYRVTQLEQDMAKLKSEVGINKSSMSEIVRQVGIYMGK
jgi:hypothetical protein